MIHEEKHKKKNKKNCYVVIIVIYVPTMGPELAGIGHSGTGIFQPNSIIP